VRAALVFEGDETTRLPYARCAQFIDQARFGRPAVGLSEFVDVSSGRTISLCCWHREVDFRSTPQATSFKIVEKYSGE